MKKLQFILVFILGTMMYWGCEQQNITEVEKVANITLENLADSWTLKKLEVTDQENSSSSTDLVSLGFAAGTVVINSTGGYSAEFNIFGDKSTETGSVSIKQDSLVIQLDDVDGDKVYAVKLTDAILTLSGEDNVDINFDGVDDPVFTVMDLVKTNLLCHFCITGMK